MSLLLSIQVLLEHFQTFLKVIELFFHLILLLQLIRGNFFMLGLLFLQILKEFHVFLLGHLQAVRCIVSEFINYLKSLNGFSLDL